MAEQKAKTTLFNSKEEADKAYKRQLEKNFEIAAGYRKIKKVHRRRGNESFYGFEISRV